MCFIPWQTSWCWSCARPIPGRRFFIETLAWGLKKLRFLRGIAPFEHGVLSHDTLNHAMNALDGGWFAVAFTSWVDGLREAEPDVVAIDGKTSRRWKSDRRRSRAKFEARCPDDAGGASHLAARRVGLPVLRWSCEQRASPRTAPLAGQVLWPAHRCDRQHGPPTARHGSHLPMRLWVMAGHIGPANPTRSRHCTTGRSRGSARRISLADAVLWHDDV